MLVGFCWDIDLISSILWNYRHEMLSSQADDSLQGSETRNIPINGALEAGRFWESISCLYINRTSNEEICLWPQSWNQGPPHGCSSHRRLLGIDAPEPICYLIYLPVTGTVLEENQKMTNCFCFKGAVQAGCMPRRLDFVLGANMSSRYMITFWQTPSSKWRLSPFTKGLRDTCSVSLKCQLPNHMCSRGQTHPTLQSEDQGIKQEF